MRVLNLCYSSTGNTSRVAGRIDQTLQAEGHQVDSVMVKAETDVDILGYDLVLAGSGVYAWLPGKPMQDLCQRLMRRYVQDGQVKPACPKVPGRWAAVYCTYGGVHTGINEAVPALRYLAQLFDHLGFTLLAEWYVVGAYMPEKMQDYSISGRLGDIRGRPDEHDLKEVEEKVRGLLRALG